MITILFYPPLSISLSGNARILMKTILTSHHPANRRLLLIFSGWSTSPALYSDITAEGWDVMTLYDYSDLSLDTAPLEGYATIFVVAWSLGVVAAEYAARTSMRHIPVAAAFAINGTLFPAHDRMGIPTQIFDGTERTLNPRNLARFRHRLSSPRDPYRFPEDSPAAISPEEENDSNRLIDRLRLELRTLRDLLSSLPDTPGSTCGMPWRRAYISDNDLIFPAASQQNAWNQHPLHPAIFNMEGGHFIPLQNIARSITPDHQSIGHRFARAAATYADHASAQHSIARHLAELLPADHLPQSADMIEIGAGTGSLTRAISSRAEIGSATFIDLYPLSPFGLFASERYVEADAEEWLDSVPDGAADLIASASTIQWFADPARFFRNAMRILRPGGILLCSTFLPGNLAQLDSLRPTPLLYPDAGELSEMLRRAGFSHIALEDEKITLTFPTPRELLMHLKLTGVAGGTRALTRQILTLLPSPASLTYRPLYLRAIK